MPYVIRYKTGETDDLFWSLDDAKDNVDSRHRVIKYIVELDEKQLYFRRCEKNTIWYVYSSTIGDIQGLFLSEEDAATFTNNNGWKVEKDYYLKRLLTPYGRYNKLKKMMR